MIFFRCRGLMIRCWRPVSGLTAAPHQVLTDRASAAIRPFSLARADCSFASTCAGISAIRRYCQYIFTGYYLYSRSIGGRIAASVRSGRFVTVDARFRAPHLSLSRAARPRLAFAAIIWASAIRQSLHTALAQRASPAGVYVTRQLAMPLKRYAVRRFGWYGADGGGVFRPDFAPASDTPALPRDYCRFRQ